MTNVRSSALNRLVAQRLTAAREACGLTQDDLSRRMGGGLSRAVIASLESGRQRIGLDQLYEIADALECDPTKFLPNPKELPAAAGARDKALASDPSAEKFLAGIVRPRRPMLGNTGDNE